MRSLLPLHIIALVPASHPCFQIKVAMLDSANHTLALLVLKYY